MHGIRKFLLFFSALLTAASLCAAATPPADSERGVAILAPSSSSLLMSPEMALATFKQRAERQINEPVSYSANTVVDAELPATSQKGEYRLRRRFIAPKTLLFTPVRFVGDNFVKSNVITRLLQTEVERVNKGEGASTAINEANYRFSYKGSDKIDGSAAHVFQVKPRVKRPGLFKGRIYLDAGSGSLRRAEGTLVKTQSIFIKKIEFVQDYADFEGFTLPVHARSVAKTRLVGRAVVEVTTDSYDLAPSTTASAQNSSSGGSQ